MLTLAVPEEERVRIVALLRDAIDRIRRDLAKLDKRVESVRSLLSPQEDPISLDGVVRSKERALHHVERADTLLSEGSTGPAFSHILHLVEELRDGVAGVRTMEDIGAMLAEARQPPTHKAIAALENLTRSIVARADQLFELTTTAQQDLSEGVTPMTDASTQDGTAQALRDLGEMLAVTLGGPAASASPARGTGRRYQAVADQMMASLDAFGLPHDGVQLPPEEDEAAIRSRLIDGLNRNFAFKDQDGYRTYYRSAPQPIVHDAEADSRLLRGAMLVNANMLRAQADGVLAILDRLPEMLRFTPVRNREVPDARARAREALDQLVDTARDPMGINVARGGFQWDRLYAAVTDVLELGEIVPAEFACRMRDPDEPRYSYGAFAQDRTRLINELRATTSVSRNDEVLAETVSLFELMDAIQRRITGRVVGAGRSAAVGRLEELMTVSYDAAVALEDDLSRLGTSVVEQTVLFFADDGVPELSVGQYIAWVRAVCEPFVRVDNRAASLTWCELELLHKELASLTGFSARLGRADKLAYSIGLPGVRRQLQELDAFLTRACEQAGKLVEKDETATTAPTPAPTPPPPAPPAPPPAPKV